MTKVIFACDESGAKGYSDKHESFEGETGVFAGFLLDAACLPQILPDFQAIYNRYVPPTGKFHIADLPSDEQEALRQDVYAAVTKHRLPCFWYAVHVAGFYDYHSTTNASMNAEKKRIRKARGEPRVKRGSSREKFSSLHVALFSGLYANLIAFLEERERKHVEVEIRSDQIDGPIITEFEEQMQALLDESPQVHHGSGYDTVTKEVVRGQIVITTKFPPEMQIDIVLEKVVINPTNFGDPFVLAADVIANSLNHHFSHRDAAQKYRPLNRLPAISGHPLEKSFDAFLNWGHGDLVGDGLFRHPKAPS